MLLSDPMFQTGIGLFDDEKEEENIFSTMPHKPPSKTVDAVSLTAPHLMNPQLLHRTMQEKWEMIDSLLVFGSVY